MIHSSESESALLGALLIDPHETISACEDHNLREDHLFNPSHQCIFTAVTKMISLGTPVDLVTLTDSMRQAGTLETAGGPAALTTLLMFGPSASSVPFYINIIKSKARQRQVIARCTQLIELASRDDPDTIPILEQTLHALTEDESRSLSIHDQTSQTLDRIQAAAEGRLEPAISTGIPKLDEAIGGLFQGEMVTIKAATGQGKTSLAHQILRHVTLNQHRSALLFSLEMPSFDVINRIVSAEASIPVSVIRRGKFLARQLPAFNAAMNRLAASKLQIIDNADIDITSIRSKARTEKRRAKIELAVVDYCQKVRPSRSCASREREVAEISDYCQKMAMELSIPVLLLSQQNEDGAVRESRTLGMDSKVLLALESDPEDDSKITPSTLVIAKSSHGRVGKIQLNFNKEFTRFE